MSKELIEKLKAAAVEFGSGSLGNLMHEAADALEAKAAPVGELWAVHAQGPDEIYPAFDRADAERHAAELNAIPTPPGISVAAVVIPSPLEPLEHWKGVAEQEREHTLALFAHLEPTDANLSAMRRSGLSIDGAAYQRAQQPQSAEPVEWRCRVAGSDHYAHFPTKRCRFCEPLYTTPQPSAGVVMPEVKPEIQQKDKRGDYPSQDCYNDGIVDGWNACLDEFARLNGKEVGRG